MNGMLKPKFPCAFCKRVCCLQFCAYGLIFLTTVRSHIKEKNQFPQRSLLPNRNRYKQPHRLYSFRFGSGQFYDNTSGKEFQWVLEKVLKNKDKFVAIHTRAVRKAALRAFRSYAAAFAHKMALPSSAQPQSVFRAGAYLPVAGGRVDCNINFIA